MKTAKQASEAWGRAANGNTPDPERVLEGWKRMYVEGKWSLAELEAHLEGMLPVLFPRIG